VNFAVGGNANTPSYEPACNWAVAGQTPGATYPFGDEPIQLELDLGSSTPSGYMTDLRYSCSGAGARGQLAHGEQALAPKPGCVVALQHGGYVVIGIADDALITVGVALPDVGSRSVVALWDHVAMLL